MSLLFVLFEHSAGYGLFRVKEFEEVGMLEAEVEKNVLDASKFKSVVQLVGFMPFKSAANALDNCNSISEGVLHEDLQLFLETNLPKSSKKQKVTLGVADAKIGAAIQEALSISVQAHGVVPEIIRGLRLHFHNFVKGFTAVSSAKAQLGLGHSYSRAKVKFNVNRIDNMIIQSISLLDQLDKDVNTFSMRIREWYGYHFPEMVKIVSDNGTYAQLAKFIGNRKDLDEDKLEGIENIVMDSAKARAIVDSAKISMGMDISDMDLANVEKFAVRVISLTNYRKRLAEYLKSKMGNIAPNLAALIGETVGARLISHAGSLTSLAKYPASTVQILGAEKALFRALKTRGNTPKYGLIFHSTFIGRAASQNKGRISRYLANKCSIASRIDCFSETQSTVFGEKLKEQVEERLKFYESGSIPRKNIDVMKLAIIENADEQAKLLLKKKKKKDKKKNKDKSGLDETTLNESTMNGDDSKSAFETTMNDSAISVNGDSQKKKKKKKKSKDESQIENSANDTVASINGESEKKKKKKRKDSEMNESVNNGSMAEEPPKKKKKKDKNVSF